MTTTNIVEIDDNETGNTKWRYSCFFLTVNTNRSDKTLEPKFRDILKNDLLPNIIDFLKWTDANKSRMGELKDHIRPDTQISFKIEYGGKLGRLHTHILLRFAHTTYIRCDVAKIKSHVQDKLGLNGIKVDIKVVDSQVMRITDYLKKNPYKFAD